MFSFPLLHAFAAGSALSSTSLGTVLTLLAAPTIGLDMRKTRLGTALLGAAVMDDVVAFILSEILKLVGQSSGPAGNLGGHIGRTIGVTIGIGVVCIPLARWGLRPAYVQFRTAPRWHKVAQSTAANVLIMTCLFIGLVAACGYAGTSPLYGAYLGGLVVSYLDSLPLSPSTPHTTNTTTTLADIEHHSMEVCDVGPSRPACAQEALSTTPITPLTTTFTTYITPLLLHLLLPLFFGSIGYSIPFIPLWKGKTIWRGIVYSLLMAFAKCLCGAWVLVWNPLNGVSRDAQGGDQDDAPSRVPPSGKRGRRIRQALEDRARASWKGALLLGSAMIARGEIGLL